ncbi:MAG: hypothetical protein K6E27_03235 [Eubacterium sp.]|nr:hypothetical protein [Eubacterium sp.]
MRKKAISILVAAMMTLGLAGCGGIKVTENIKNRDDNTETSTEATTEASKIELNVSEINEYGEVVKGITVPAGTTYYVLTTEPMRTVSLMMDVLYSD